MAGTELRVSELPTAASLDDSDLLLLSQVDANSQTGYASAKTTNVALATKVAKQTNFSDLQTTSKTIIGAINEAAQSGGSDVEVTPILTEGTKIATITVDNVPTDIYGENTKEELEKLSTEKTVTGNPVTFETINGGMAKSCEVTMNPIQDLHGYSNPWAGGVGKNKLQNTATSATVAGVTYTVNSDGTIIANGTATANSNLYIYGTDSYYVNIGISAGNYIMNGGNTNSIFYVIRRRSGSNTNFTSRGEDVSIDIEEGDTFRVMVRVGSGVTVNNELIKPMIRLSTVTDATFAPYSNICPISGWDSLHLYQDTEQTETPETTHTATFPDTVYGGKLDFVSGKLYVTHKIVDLSTLTFTKTGSGYTERFQTEQITDIKLSGSNQIPANAICSSYPNVSWDNMTSQDTNKVIAVQGTNTRVAIRNTDYSNASDFMASLSSADTFCYELATPIEITLTAEQIELLKGNNVLWTDGDEIKLTASELANIQDLLTYIQSLEARIKALEEA